MSFFFAVDLKMWSAAALAMLLLRRRRRSVREDSDVVVLSDVPSKHELLLKVLQVFVMRNPSFKKTFRVITSLEQLKGENRVLLGVSSRSLRAALPYIAKHPTGTFVSPTSSSSLKTFSDGIPSQVRRIMTPDDSVPHTMAEIVANIAKRPEAVTRGDNVGHMHVQPNLFEENRFQLDCVYFVYSDSQWGRLAADAFRNRIRQMQKPLVIRLLKYSDDVCARIGKFSEDRTVAVCLALFKKDFHAYVQSCDRKVPHVCTDSYLYSDLTTDIATFAQTAMFVTFYGSSLAKEGRVQLVGDLGTSTAAPFMYDALSMLVGRDEGLTGAFRMDERGDRLDGHYLICSVRNHLDAYRWKVVGVRHVTDSMVLGDTIDNRATVVLDDRRMLVSKMIQRCGASVSETVTVKTQDKIGQTHEWQGPADVWVQASDDVLVQSGELTIRAAGSLMQKKLVMTTGDGKQFTYD